FEIVQLLEMAIADLAPRLVTFPDKSGIAARGIFVLGVDEGRVPAPGIGAGEAHAALQKIERRIAAHAAAGGDVIRLAIGRAGAGIDDDDLERLQLMADARELVLDIRIGDNIAVGKIPEIE